LSFKKSRIGVLQEHDRFANDFLDSLKKKYPGEWSRIAWTVKVLYWESDWSEAMPLFNSLTIGNPAEYTKRPNTLNPEAWGKVNAFDVVQPTGLSREEHETILLTHGFEDLARPLSPFDALVIVNAGAVEKRSGAGVPFPDLGLITHETIHITEQLRGEVILSQWDQEHDYESPEAMKLFNKFMTEEVGIIEFAKRYAPSTYGRAHPPIKP